MVIQARLYKMTLSLTLSVLLNRQCLHIRLYLLQNKIKAIQTPENFFYEKSSIHARSKLMLVTPKNVGDRTVKSVTNIDEALKNGKLLYNHFHVKPGFCGCVQMKTFLNKPFGDQR